MFETNAYCKALGIKVPCLEDVRNSPEANFYSLLIVALLERGEPLTLEEAARRFEQAGVAPAAAALASLKRCKPGRPPILRDGESYALDPYDDETDHWVFRLGLRPRSFQMIQVVRPDPGPLPSLEAPLSVADLEEAWQGGVPAGWSAQRIAICVLDAHDTVMRADEALTFLKAFGPWSLLSIESARFWRGNGPIRVRESGLWELDRQHDAVRSARVAILVRLAKRRQSAQHWPDPVAMAAHRARIEREREAHAAELARMRRVIVHAFPTRAPEIVVLLDVGRREMTTFVGPELATVREAILSYDIIAAVDVRALLRSLDIEPGERRLGELGPPQKTKQLKRRGHTLSITTTLLVQGSCDISRPFGSEKALAGYLRSGKIPQLRRRLEADARSLLALYEYGRLHGGVRLRWGSIDEMLPAPWVHRDEPIIYDLMKQAQDLDVPLEVVIGPAPGWDDPWSWVEPAYVQQEAGRWDMWLVDELGCEIAINSIQLARVPEAREGEV